MERTQFKDGKQKEFLEKVMLKVDAPSIRSLLQFGFKTNYSSLKNYSSERRLLPEDLVDDFCFVAKINKDDLDFELRESNWGQKKGGKKSKRKK